MKERITKLAQEIAGRATEIRHDLHRHPEIAYDEKRTSVVIRDFLNSVGVTNDQCTETGVVATVGSGGGRTVALRADIDALPMPDLSGLPHASENTGVAHACGHDGHTAILLGAAWALKQLEGELKGTVKFIFQPAEEIGRASCRERV